MEVEEEEAEAPPAKAPQDEGAQQVVVLAGLSGGHICQSGQPAERGGVNRSGMVVCHWGGSASVDAFVLALY